MNPILAAIVEFVGLCMFMQGNDRYTVHVVLPNVQEQSVTHRPVPVATRGDIQLVQSRDKFKVDPRLALDHKVITMDQHTAIIAWLGAPESVVNWTPKTLKPVPQYQYVELKGEQIRIIGNGQSPPPGVPPNLPKVTNACEKEKLRPDYVARSAAIVKLDEGTLTACRPKIKDAPASRVDTTLTLETTGPIIIETLTKPVRRLALKASDLVIIGNVPTVWVNSAPDTTWPLHGEAGHYQGFYTVLTSGGAGCAHQDVGDVPVCGGEGPGFHVTAPEPAGPASTNDTGRFAAGNVTTGRQGFKTDARVWREGTTAPSTPTSGPCPNCFVTYACSNSQYP